jgi:ABC-type amino acid transport substrate-binding protein
MAGLLHWQRPALARFVVVATVASVVTLGGARVLFSTALRPVQDTAAALDAMSLPVTAAPVVMHDDAEEIAPESASARLDAIRARGALRVGYLPDSLPFAFVNRHGTLVGFDIELAHRLATELGVGLHLVSIAREEMGDCLDSGRCDLVMSGVVVSTERASRLLLSTSYLDETLAFIVPDHERGRFRTWAEIAVIDDLTVGVPNIAYYAAQLQQLIPHARLEPVTSIADLAARTTPVDALAFPAERGSAWTLMHPQYSVVVPEGTQIKVPLAYPVARDAALLTFVNTWIELKRRDGSIDRAFRYWILGQTMTSTTRRWAFARDVLHWID